MPKTKILGISQHFYPEMVSTGLHMTELFTGLAKSEENECQIFCAYPIKKEYRNLNPPRIEVVKNVNVTRTKNIGTEHKSIFARMVYNLSFVLKACIFAIRKRKTFDKILLTTDPPFIAIIPLIIKKLFGKPFVLIIYDIFPDIAVKLGVLSEKSLVTKMWTKINRIVYRNANTLVVIGEDMKQIIQELMPDIKDENIKLIHNWSDSNEVYPVPVEENIFIKEQGLKDKTILLYSGNMGRTHNIEAILESAIELEKIRPDVVFIFIGGGIKKEKVNKHIEDNLSSNVISLPFQPFEILSHVLSSAAFAWVCLEDEFTGMSVPSKTYGIMAAGTPILGLLRSDSEISQTIIKHNCGAVWNSESDQRLTDVILKLLSDKDALDLYGKNAYSAFLENYDLNISVDHYHNLIQSI